MLINIADIDKIELFIELNNIAQASPFGQGNIIKDQDTAKRMLAEANNDYCRFDLYCDISKDTVDTHNFNNLYGDGSAIFEKIVFDLRAKKNGNTVLEKVAHVSQVAPAAPVVVGVFFSASAGDVKLAKEQQASKLDASASAGDIKLVKEHSKLSELDAAAVPVSVSSDISNPAEELTPLQGHAKTLIEKLETLILDLRSQMYIDYRGSTPQSDASSEEIARHKSQLGYIDDFRKNIVIAQKILNSQEINKEDRASLQTLKDDFDKHSAKRPGISALIGRILIILDAQSNEDDSDISQPKKQEELTGLQEHANALLKKLQTMTDEQIQAFRSVWQGKIPTLHWSPVRVDAWKHQRQEIEDFKRNLFITQNILNSQEMSKEDRASLQTMKDNFDKNSAGPSRTSAMIGTVLAIMDARNKAGSSAAKP